MLQLPYSRPGEIVTASSSATSDPPDSPRSWHGWVGILLIGAAWPLNWLLPGLRTHLLFFPLWLGFTLVVDRIVLARRGRSMFMQSRKDFVLLFLFSAPVWWFFEVINWRTQNWQYLGREQFSDLTYFILASIAFSTVIPAVFEAADLAGTFHWVRRIRRGVHIPRSRRTAGVLFTLGIVMLALLLIWPTYFYLFTWGALFALLEPVNMLLGRRSIFDYLEFGDWRPVVALSLGALLCGFFWELWNYYAYPKWIYHTPGVGFWYIFEMPLIGFIGYLPFAWELYAVANLVQLDPYPGRLSFEE